jgi:hypothetical protein
MGRTAEKQPPPERLTLREYRRVVAWARGRWSNQQLSPADLDDFIEECLCHFQSVSKAKWRANYALACINWIRKEMRQRGERERTAARRYGYATRSEGGDVWERFRVRNGYRHENDPRRNDPEAL